MTALGTPAATEQLSGLINGHALVVCGRTDDAQAWTRALGEQRCLAIGLDDVALQARHSVGPSETGRQSFHHDAINGLDGSGWLSALADRFDPHQQASLLIPDPLDPSTSGARRRLGRRRAVWRLFEDKTIIDGLWDQLAIPRPPCVIADSLGDLLRKGSHFDEASGIVCVVQQAGATPSSGAEGIWWWRNGVVPAMANRAGSRFKLMPLIPGLPVRLHGMVLRRGVVPFPAMEIIALPRLDRGTFLCCGAITAAAIERGLVEFTQRIGYGLRELLDYRGGFSIDGIMSDDGFWPTDLNTRLTSAMEAAPPDIRVQMQAANILAREDADLDAGWLADVADQVFIRPILTVYGASNRVAPTADRTAAVCWDSGQLVVAHDRTPDGQLRIGESLRGWTLVAEFDHARVPPGGPFVGLAPEIFRLSDQIFGTDFGDLTAPFGVGHR